MIPESPTVVPAYTGGTTAPVVKAAVVARLESLVGVETEVRYGGRGPMSASEIIAVMNMTTQANTPTMRGTSPRSKEETHLLTIVSSVSYPSPTGQQQATERAYALIDLLAQNVRTIGQEQFGAGVRILAAEVISYDLDEFTDDPEVQASGRYAAVVSILQVVARPV